MTDQDVPMGSPDEFSRLALPHLDAAHNLAYWIVRNRADAEDVVHDAYLRAFRAFASFTEGNIRNWLLAIVRNTAYTAMTRRNRGHNVVSIEEAMLERADADASWVADDRSAEDGLILQEEGRRVRDALVRLAPSFREVIVLREIEELSYEDIARVLGVPIGTVMSRLSRARTQLREIYDRNRQGKRDAV